MKVFTAVFAFALLALSLSFAGDYSVFPITYTALQSDSYRVATTPGDVACGASPLQDWSYTAKLIEINSCAPIFGGPNDSLSGNHYFSKIFFDPIGVTGSGSTSLNGTANQSTPSASWSPRVFYKLPGRDCYNWDYTSMGSSVKVNIGSAGFYFGNQGVGGLFFGYNGPASPIFNFGQAVIGLYEQAGPYNGAASVGASIFIPVIVNDTTASTMRFMQSGASTQQLAYASAIGGSSAGIYEPPFTTERGTVVTSVGTSDVSIKLAQTIAQPEFVFSAAGVAPTHTFSTLISDTVDRMPMNRRYNTTDDMWPASLSDADTNGAITSPLRGAEGNTTTTAKLLYRIGSAQFAPFADYVAIDPQAPFTNLFVETQSFWAGSKPNAVAYDSSSGIKTIDVNKYSAIAYSAKFDGYGFGIPVCTGDLNSSTPDDWTSCPVDSTSSRTDTHRMNVKFMGSDWIISGMEAPSAPLASGTAAINGGQIKLAKEAAYGIVNVNGSLSSSQFTVQLADVFATGQQQTSNMLVDILDANGTLVGQILLPPQTNFTFTQAGTGNVVVIYADPYLATQQANVTVYFGNNTNQSVLNIGDVLGAGSLSVRLNQVGIIDLVPPYYALFSILQNGSLVGQVQIQPGQTYTFTSGSNSVKIHVYQVAPGWSPYAKWAEVAIYSDEIYLKDGQRYNLVNSMHPDKDFRVSLLWKNRDYGTVGPSEQPDSLREIVVYNTNGFDTKTLQGQSVTMLNSTPTYSLKYNGISAVPVCNLASNIVVSCNASSIIGDADGNGFVNTIDAQLVLQLSVGLLPMPANKCCVDVNNDTAVNSADSLMIAKYFVGMSGTGNVGLLCSAINPAPQKKAPTTPTKTTSPQAIASTAKAPTAKIVAPAAGKVAPAKAVSSSTKKK